MRRLFLGLLLVYGSGFIIKQVYAGLSPIALPDIQSDIQRHFQYLTGHPKDSRYFPSPLSSENNFTKKDITQINRLLGISLLTDLYAPSLQCYLVQQNNQTILDNQITQSNTLLPNQKEIALHEKIGKLLNSGNQADATSLIQAATDCDYTPTSLPIYTVSKSQEDQCDFWDTSENITVETINRIKGALAMFSTKQPIENIVSFTKNPNQEEVYIAYTDGSIIRYRENHEPEAWMHVPQKIKKIFLDAEKQMLFCLTKAGMLDIWHLASKEKTASISLNHSIKNATPSLDRKKIKTIDKEEQKHVWSLQKLSTPEILFLKSFQSACDKKEKNTIALTKKSQLFSWYTAIKPHLEKDKQKRVAIIPNTASTNTEKL